MYPDATAKMMRHPAALAREAARPDHAGLGARSTPTSATCDTRSKPTCIPRLIKTVTGAGYRLAVTRDHQAGRL